MDVKEDELIIGKQKIHVKLCELNQSELKFYEENPRVYSSLNTIGTPTQEEIEEYMINQDHVKQLKVSIESNGGLIDPLIVRDGDYTVLEGNSRLAAYRLLATSKDAIQWAKVKVKLLPADISDKTIFQLLGQYHIIGRKDWEPFEQANYLYRRQQNTKIPIETMAKELGITAGLAKKMIETIKFMIAHNDLKKNNWSCYDEYLKNASIKKYRETNISIDDTIVNAIKADEIRDAKDIRKLGEIARVGDKQSKKIMNEIAVGNLDIYEGYEEMKDSGKLEDAIKKLKKFRDFVNENSIENQLMNSEENRKQALFEITKIIKRLENIKAKLEE